jgi:hypothetical protein
MEAKLLPIFAAVNVCAFVLGLAFLGRVIMDRSGKAYSILLYVVVGFGTLAVALIVLWIFNDLHST